MSYVSIYLLVDKVYEFIKKDKNNPYFAYFAPYNILLAGTGTRPDPDKFHTDRTGVSQVITAYNGVTSLNLVNKSNDKRQEFQLTLPNAIEGFMQRAWARLIEIATACPGCMRRRSARVNPGLEYNIIMGSPPVRRQI